MIGGDAWSINPKYAVPPAIFHVVRLWRRCQSGMGGYAQLPEPGGINAQPAWLMEAFSFLTATEASNRESDKEGGGA